jgi:proline iminopeptidase
MEKINRFITNGDTTIHTNIYSPEKSKETIILLHGGPGVPDEMREVVDYFRDNYSVINFEQRGVGLSNCGNSGFKIENYISDLDKIADEFNVEKFHLFGHSWGGLYAQIYAYKRTKRIKSLFLCSPSSGTNQTWKKTEKEVLQFNKRMTNFSEWMRMGLNSLLGMFGSDKAYRRMFEQVLKNYHSEYGKIPIDIESLNGVHAKPINKTRKEIIEYEPLTELKDTNFPIIITYGDNDIYGDSKSELINRFPTANVRILENCGHIPWKHNLSKFKSVLDEFYGKKPAANKA